MVSKSVLVLLLLLISFYSTAAGPSLQGRASTPETTSGSTSQTQLPKGVVCITASNMTACPSTPPILTGTVGSQLTVNVNINSSAALNGFEVWVKTDPKVLNATSASLTGTILPAPLYVVDECINGAVIQGPRCLSVDGPGVVNLGVVCLSCLVSAPATGLLYSITYNVLGTSSSTIGFQTGCNNSSVTNTTVCVQITDGQSVPVPVTITDPEFSQPACFTNQCTSLSQAISFNNLMTTITGSLSIDPTSQTLTGFVSVTTLNSTGATVFSKTYTISLAIGSGDHVKLAFTQPTTLLAATCWVSYSTPPSIVSCMVTRNPDVDWNGTVDIVDVSTIAIAYNSAIGSTRYNPVADLNLDGKIDILDVALVAYAYGATIY